MPEEKFTPSEVKIIEMLASIRTTQKFTLERLEAINGTIARHEHDLRQQSVFLEGHRHELAALQGAVQRNTELVTGHEAALRQSRGIWRAVVASTDSSRSQ